MMHHFLCGRLVLSLVGTVVVLQIIHIVLLNRLESRQVNSHAPQPKLSQVVGKTESVVADLRSEIDTELSFISSFVEKSWVLDAHGEYHVSLLVPQASGGVGPVFDVTLATQCSHDHLNDLLPLLVQWKGHISVAVFTSSEYLWDTLYSVANLRIANRAVRLNVTFSIVWPVTTSFGLPPRTPNSRPHPTHAHNYDHQEAYPNNLLRNTARKAALTDFVFVVDIDMLPNSQLRQDFLKFVNLSGWFQIESSQAKTVFVVPAFEGNVLPYNKTDLISAVEAGKIRPFYSQLCWKCQAHTDYENWLHWPFHLDLSVIYDVLWKDPWEPFYISHKSIPFYDERFKQYGFNRISQICELHVSGYKFSVLNNAFLVHKGFKTQSSFHVSKEKELEQNRLLFRKFKAELKYKYAESSRRCY